MPNTSIGGLVSGLDTATIISQLMQLEARPADHAQEQGLDGAEGRHRPAGAQHQAGEHRHQGRRPREGHRLERRDGHQLQRQGHRHRRPRRDAPTSVELSRSTARRGAPQPRTRRTARHGTDDTVMAAGVDLPITYDDGRAAETINTGDGTLAEHRRRDQRRRDRLKATLVKVGAADGRHDADLPAPGRLDQRPEQTPASRIDDGDPATRANPMAFMGGTSAARRSGRRDHGRTDRLADFGVQHDHRPDAGRGRHARGRLARARPRPITVARDVASLTDSVKGMVDAVNAALDEIGTLTAYDATTKKGGLLAGDSTMRGLRNQLLETVSSGSVTPVRHGDRVAGHRRHPGRPVRQAHLRRGEVQEPPTRPTRPGRRALIAGTDPASGHRHRLRRQARGARQDLQRLHRRHAHPGDQEPPVGDQGHGGRHRRLGRPPGDPAGDAPAAVHRPRVRPRQAPEPGQLARRTDRLAAEDEQRTVRKLDDEQPPRRLPRPERQHREPRPPAGHALRPAASSTSSVPPRPSGTVTSPPPSQQLLHAQEIVLELSIVAATGHLGGCPAARVDLRLPALRAGAGERRA